MAPTMKTNTVIVIMACSGERPVNTCGGVVEGVKART
jgi:hypothetical protein